MGGLGEALRGQQAGRGGVELARLRGSPGTGVHVMSLAGARNKRQRKGDGMADSFTRSILMKDLVALQKKPLPFAWIPEDVLIDDNILTWQMWLLGPEGTQLCVPRALSALERTSAALSACPHASAQAPSPWRVQ